ncbi:hypothetical protein, partial [Pseudomonas aeruginosa]
MKKFTIIATHESTGQIVASHVYGDSSLNAFAAAAAMDPDLTLVVALPGWQSEDEGMFFPGWGYAEIRGKLGHLASKLLILKMSAGEILIHITGPWTYDPCPKL